MRRLYLFLLIFFVLLILSFFAVAGELTGTVSGVAMGEESQTVRR